MTRMPNLNRLLVVEMRERVPDGFGGFVETTVELGRLWAEVRARSARRLDADNAELAAGSYRITVRAAPPGAPSRPQPGQYLRDGGRTFRIDAVTDAGLDARFLECLATHEEVSS